MSTPVSSTATVSTTATGSNTVPIISGAIGTAFVIIIIIALIIILVYAKGHSKYNIIILVNYHYYREQGKVKS